MKQFAQDAVNTIRKAGPRSSLTGVWLDDTASILCEEPNVEDPHEDPSETMVNNSAAARFCSMLVLSLGPLATGVARAEPVSDIGTNADTAASSDGQLGQQQGQAAPVPTPVPTDDETPDVLTVLVWPLEAEGVSTATATAVTDTLAAELYKVHGLQVVTLADLNTRLEVDKARELISCGDETCAQQVGGAIDADRILSGRISRLGNVTVVALHWIDASFGTPLAHASVNAARLEDLPGVAKQALASVMGASQQEDTQARQHKRNPTFWTAELSAGVGSLGTEETYTLPVNGSLRLAWGGKPRGGRTYYYLVAGIGAAYMSGKASRQLDGVSIAYSRLQTDFFCEARTALPFAQQGRLRLVLGVGAGVLRERSSAKEQGGIHTQWTVSAPELRVLGGLWYRWQRDYSLFANGRARLAFRSRGVDSVSELVAAGSSKNVVPSYELEIGWAAHF